MKTKAYYVGLTGSNYDVGKKLANIVKEMPDGGKSYKIPKVIFSKQEIVKITKLFDEFCPGINEEIQGFADTFEVKVENVLYYAMTYLKPGCSIMTLLPSLTFDKHTLIARNYDMGDKTDEMTFCTTRIKGKYAHIGSSMILFGRGDGINDKGLSVVQSSAGMPVGQFEFMKKPAIVGLQFWAVIRAILENCVTVDEALALIRDMPIAYNINLILCDKKGNAALFETLDGNKAVKKIDASTKDQFLCATNHVVLPELQHFEEKKMKNSHVRYELINKTLKNNSNITKEDLKNLLSKKYPEGLSCNYYEDFFGTLRSMIFDSTEVAAYVRFGSSGLNAWHKFDFNNDVEYDVYEVDLKKERCLPDFYKLI